MGRGRKRKALKSSPDEQGPTQQVKSEVQLAVPAPTSAPTVSGPLLWKRDRPLFACAFMRSCQHRVLFSRPRVDVLSLIVGLICRIDIYLVALKLDNAGLGGCPEASVLFLASRRLCYLGMSL